MSDELFDREKENPSLFDLQLDPVAQQHIAAVSQWAKIIAIIVLAIMGLGVFGVVSVGEKLSQEFVAADINFSEGMGPILVVILILVVVIGVWLYFLLRGAQLLKTGLATGNNEVLGAGFRMLRIFFTISTVLSILSIISLLTTIF
jgi:hypothetical protein